MTDSIRGIQVAAFCLILACEPASLGGPQVAETVAATSTEVPIFEQFQDLNPCTGRTVTHTFSGSALIRQAGPQSILVGRGTVTTSDGFSGTFNRTFVIGDQVTHLRFHDMEIRTETGQRIIFGVGLFHQTTVQGEPVVTFEHFSGVRCVGPR
jgi:hypothetical protein